MIFVTGHKGFIGSHLVKHLKAHRYNVIGLDAVAGDVFDQLDYIDWKDITEIYHLGAVSDTTETNIGKIYKHNIQFSLELFHIAATFDIPIKYASSASVYGNSGNEYNPLNYYALSKQTVDLWLKDNIRQFRNVVGFRFFNVYGNPENKSEHTMSPVSKFMKQAKETGIIEVFEDSDNMVRDFICIDDVIKIMTKDHLSGIYDLGTGRPISFQKVAELVSEKYGATIKTIPFPEKLRNKYQFYTKSNHFYDHDFISVEDWLKSQ